MSEEKGSIHESYNADEEAEFKTMLEPDKSKPTDAASEEEAKAAAEAASEEAAKAGDDDKVAEELAAELKKKADEAATAGKTVPLEALHESRMETREMREQMMDVQRQLGTMLSLKEELAAIRDKGTKDEKAEAIAAEDKLFEDDPIAALQAKVTRLQGEQDSAAEDKTKADETTAATQKKMEENQIAMVNFQNEVKSKVAEFEVENPDYSDAFKFLMERRMKDFAALGITDPMEQQKNFDIETIAMANNAMQRGVNPAKAAYELAKNWGYTKTAADDKGDKDDKASGDEATKAATELATKKKALQDQIALLEKGQAAASTLAGSGGGAPESGPSLTDIEQMSDADFDKLWDTMESSSIF